MFHYIKKDSQQFTLKTKKNRCISSLRLKVKVIECTASIGVQVNMNA